MHQRFVRPFFFWFFNLILFFDTKSRVQSPVQILDYATWRQYLPDFHDTIASTFKISDDKYAL